MPVSTKVPPLIAEVLAFKEHSYQYIWKQLKAGPQKVKPLKFNTNTLGFEYNPTEDTFTVWVTFGVESDGSSEATLKTTDFHKELAKYARGAP